MTRPRILGYCKACRIPMISEYAWRGTSPKLRPENVGYHTGKGLCGRCTSRAKRRGGDPKAPAPERWNAAPTRIEDVPVQHCEDCQRPMAGPTNLARFPSLREAGWIRIGGQGYCTTCYGRHWEAGTLERTTRSREEVLDDWVWLRDDGFADTEVAARRMGMTKVALEQALYRARKRGDQRGSLIPFAHDMRRAA